MKKVRLSLCVVVLGLFILGLTSSNAGAVYLGDGFEDEVLLSDQLQPEPEPEPGYVPGEIIVKFKSLETVAEIDKALSRANKVKKLTVDSALSGVSSIADFTTTLNVNIEKIEPVFKALKEKIEDTGMTEDELAQEAFEESTQGVASATLTTTSYGLSRVYMLTVDKSVDILEACAVLADDSNVEYAEPNYIYTIQRVPNDPYYHSSGAWDQDYDDLWGLKKIQSEEAWDITIGSPDVIVAVIDTGVDYNHEDLADNIWINEGEIPDNGIDDDGNGYIDDVRGWHFAYGDNDPQDGHGHGTHVSGTIAAVTDNAIGVAGISWSSKIMPVKGLDDQGGGESDQLAGAIVYAADNGARVINCSWGGERFNQLLKDAVDYAHDVHNCVVVASAGNDNRDTSYFYPTSFNNVIAVAAFDHNDEKASWSNWGAKIDVAAPGVKILSLRALGTDMYEDGIHIVDETYYWANGTSMAAPHVSGVAALILAQHPEFTNEEVRQVLRKAADDVGEPGWDIHSGYGRINAYASLNIGSVGPLCTADITFPTGSTRVEDATIDIIGTAQGDNFLSYRLEYGNGKFPTEWVPLGEESFSPVSQDVLLASVDTTLIKDGYNILKLTVTDTFGNEFTGYSGVNIDNIAITSPKDNGVFRWGTNLVIEGTAQGTGFEYYTLEYASVSDPDSWSSDGITLEGDGLSLVEDGILGRWDTSAISGRDGHIIRLRVHQGDFVNEESILVYLDPFIKEGWPVRMEVNGQADSQGRAPVTADIDGDEKLEVLIKGARGTFAYHHDGTPVIGWPQTRAGSKILAPGVSVGNLDGLGNPEIVASWYDYPSYIVGAHAWHSDGTKVANWPIQLGAERDRGFSSMVLADLDSNGDLEVIANARDLHTLFVWNYDGNSYEGWPYEVEAIGPAELVGSPAVGDIDWDGDMEIVSIARDLSYGEKRYLYCWSSQGVVEYGFPVYIGVGTTKRGEAPLLVDLDKDGYLEIGYMNQNDSQKSINFLHHDGSQVQGWPYYLDRFREFGAFSFAVGDLDKDGRVEIVFGASEQPVGWESEGKIYVLENDGTLKDGWPKSIERTSTKPPTIGDLDSDGYPDIAVTTWNGFVYAWDRNGNPLDFFPRKLPGYSMSEAVISDIDNDGKVDIVATDFEGNIFVWELEEEYDKNTMEWPMFQGNPQRTGLYTGKPVTQSIDLVQGWNIVSLGLSPKGSHDMLDILAPILGHVVYVWNGEGYSIRKDPVLGQWINGIGDWEATDGYWINMNQAATLEVVGRKIVKPLSVPLKVGTNMNTISYPYFDESRDALEVLKPLIDAGYLVNAQDEKGAAVEKNPVTGEWINNIGDMRPGEGYMLTVNTACTLEYTKLLTQTINLVQGWNIVSLGLSPKGSHDMLDILAPILDHVVKVWNEEGYGIEKQPYGNWNNSIGDWEATEGYLIDVDQDVTLEIAGREIVKPLSVPLKVGTNMNTISYPYFNESRNALEVVQPLIDAGYLVRVEDEAGAVVEIIPEIGQWRNTIGYMRPGEGYMVTVNTACTLEMD